MTRTSSTFSDAGVAEVDEEFKEQIEEVIEDQRAVLDALDE